MNDGKGLPNVRMQGQTAFDFFQFDPVTIELDLIVVSTAKLDQAPSIASA